MNKTTNIHELNARQRKALAIASLLTAKDATSDEALFMNTAGWSVAAALVGSKPPSAKTREMVISLMRQSEQGQRHADPFDKAFAARHELTVEVPK